ncbi:MAG TPA: type II 3-dehydroquinate dehydratase [Candidatus Omnitrophota bacterium]|nr:type II 3-dehydroquinate dehydratase [Candidatus Omnitrophota bacterium]
MKILVIHGPNLQLLGEREVSVYGKVTLREINQGLEREAKILGVSLDIEQSNHEGVMVDRIGGARGRYDGILINPAAYTHTSVAIRDALAASGLPAVEVHLSHIYKREDFRQHSMTAPACVAQVTGLGKDSYFLGLMGLVAYCSKIKPKKKVHATRKSK